MPGAVQTGVNVCRLYKKTSWTVVCPQILLYKPPVFISQNTLVGSLKVSEKTFGITGESC